MARAGKVGIRFVNDSFSHRSAAAALAAVGIGEPKRSELAAVPVITPALVQDVADRTRAAGGGPGLIIKRLEEAAAQQKAAGERTRRRDESAAAKRESDRQDRERLAADRRERDCILSGLTPSELKAYAEKALQLQDVRTRDRWLRANNFGTNRLWRTAAADLARADGHGAKAQPEEVTA